MTSRIPNINEFTEGFEFYFKLYWPDKINFMWQKETVTKNTNLKEIEDLLKNNQIIVLV